MQLLFNNNPGTWPHRCGLLFFLLIVFGPLASLAADTLSFLLEGSGQGLDLLLPTGRRLSLFLHSITLTLSVSTGGTFLGIAAGSALWRWRTRAGLYLRWVAVLLFAVSFADHRFRKKT